MGFRYTTATSGFGDLLLFQRRRRIMLNRVLMSRVWPCRGCGAGASKKSPTKSSAQGLGRRVATSSGHRQTPFLSHGAMCAVLPAWPLLQQVPSILNLKP